MLYKCQKLVPARGLSPARSKLNLTFYYFVLLRDSETQCKASARSRFDSSLGVKTSLTLLLLSAPIKPLRCLRSFVGTPFVLEYIEYVNP